MRPLDITRLSDARRYLEDEDEVELVEMYLHIVSTPACSWEVRIVFRKTVLVALE